ncbi:sigma-70 family RNA polymerase sigma factor [Leifsonia shinshuensis]|uniref:RNA polymerase sigma factor n=1 Tax=Leifsonia shinshuensis TaxID=150026 RepID=UPI001F50CBF1|nr:sigma-70 family RNA polymerase sigma factor [Leifsonia shinshuensis]MCI0158767.1 sigma-70 family RNA polymerase sigma factor [Leifsonia shinshuensis]
MGMQTAVREGSVDQEVGPRDDAQLILLVRRGDHSAFEELHRRHHAAAVRLARVYVGSYHSAEDVAAESFGRMYRTLCNRAGPETNFRAYLFTVVRRVAAAVNTLRAREELVDDFRMFEAAGGSYELHSGLGDGVIGEAFRALPERWQTILWYLEVEGHTTQTAAGLLGLTPNSTAALAYRARAGLRAEYALRMAL